MKYGYFDDARHEYGVTTPKAPVIWIRCDDTLALGGFANAGREFRGCRYEIRVKNPRGLHRGVTHLLVDGARIEGNQAPIFQDTNIHIIEANLGA